MGKIWLISDLHFNHQREFVYVPRGFKNVYEMNRAIIENWNRVVAPDDDVYVLGDLCLGGANSLQDNKHLIQTLKGNIHIVRGNHDTDARIEMYNECWNVVEIENVIYPFKYKGYTFYMSHFPTGTANFDDGKALKQKVICLCGHRHVKNKFKDMDKGIIYHVEMDCQNNMPIEINKIIEDLSYFFTLKQEERNNLISMEEL